MTTHLLLHHVGEVVLRALLERLSLANAFERVRCVAHRDCSLETIVAQNGLSSPPTFFDNVKLDPVVIDGASVRFDGAHGVDVLCRGGGRGLGIEAKLGLGRMSARPFRERFLKPPTLSAHDPPRCNGSMTAILDTRTARRSSSDDLHELRLTTGGSSCALATEWLLVIRKRTFAAWGDTPPPLANAHIVLFEQLASLHGGEQSFDDLVRAEIGDGFAKRWGIFE